MSGVIIVMLLSFLDALDSAARAFLPLRSPGVFSLLEPSQPWSQSNSSDSVELTVIVLEQVEFPHTCLVPDQ
jgi:hypothetical protein